MSQDRIEVTIRRKREEEVYLKTRNVGIGSRKRERITFGIPVITEAIKAMHDDIPAEVKTPDDQPTKIVTQFFRYVFLKETGMDQEWEVEYPLMDSFEDAPPRIKDLKDLACSRPGCYDFGSGHLELTDQFSQT